MTSGVPRAFARLAAVALGALVLGTPAWAESSCVLKKPPRAAGVNASHGNYFFVFPREVGVGCDFRRSAARASDCPAYEDLRNGLRTIPSEQEMQVRPASDPRKS